MKPRHVIATSVLGALVLALVAMIALGALPLGPDAASSPRSSVAGEVASPPAARAPARAQESAQGSGDAAAGGVIVPSRQMRAVARPRQQAHEPRGRCRDGERHGAHGRRGGRA